MVVIENEVNNTELMDRQVKFNVGYQPRTKADLLKVFSYMGQSAISVASKKESQLFMIRSDEIGEEEFIAFAEFASQKLPNKEIKRYQELM